MTTTTPKKKETRTTTRDPLTPPEPAPERLAPCPDCGGPLRPQGFWPADEKIGDLTVQGALVIIECANCGEEFGPPVFVARNASTDTIATVAPGAERLLAMARAAGMEVGES